MASRSAAAEARRRRILERGTDRLNRITLGTSAGDAHESSQPDASTGPTSVSAARLDVQREQQPRPEPQQTPEALNQASAYHLGKDAAHLDLNTAGGHSNDQAQIRRMPGEPRDLKPDSSAKTAQSVAQGRSDRWAQFSSSGAEDVEGQQRKSAVLLGLRQALTAAVQTTHSWRIALAALMPILAKWAAAGCAQGSASNWRSAQCSMADMPLVHLLLLQVLLVAAAVATLLAAGQGMIAEGPRVNTGLLSSQPMRMLARMMGAQQAIARLEAAMRVLKGFFDTVAVYILMAALTCTVELQMGSRSWFSEYWDPA